MENEKVVVLQLKLTKKHCLLALAFAFICFHPRPLGSETLTLTTYYPAPYGGYVSLLTTQQTLLARDGGNVGIGTTNPAGPQFKLDVTGNTNIEGVLTVTSDLGFPIPNSSRLTGLCRSVSYSIGAQTFCPSGRRPIAHYGNGAECDDLGFALIGPCGWFGWAECYKRIPPARDCGGTMLCCNIDPTVFGPFLPD